MVAIRLANAAVLAGFLETIDGVAGRAALTVSAGVGLTFPEHVAEPVARVPGVQLAVPLVRAITFPDDASGELLTVHGVDVANDAAVRVYHTSGGADDVVEDVVAFLAQPDSIIVGREFAQQRGLTVGSVLPLVTPRGVRPFTVRGVLEPEGLARTLGGRLVVMDLFAAERAFTADGQITQVDIMLAPGAQIDRVKAGIAAVLPAGLAVEEPELRKTVVRRTVSGFQAMLTAFGLLAVGAGWLICYSRLSAIFEARTWEVGLLRAVGLRQRVVFGELLKESLLLGLAGTVVGVPFGVVIGRFGLPFVSATTAINFALPVPTVAAPVDTGALVLGVAVGLFAAIAAAMVPALRLARTRPIAALALRGRELPKQPKRRILSAVLLATTVMSIVLQRVAHVTSLGNLTTLLIVATACASAGAVMRMGGGLLGAVWQMAFGPAGEFATDSLREGSRRASLTVATMGVGLGAVLMVGILGWSFERSLVAQLSGRMRADIVVTTGLVSDGYRHAPLGEEVVEELRKSPGVAHATGERQMDVPYGSGSIMIDAYDPPCFEGEHTCSWELEPGALEYPWEQVLGGTGALATASFANQYFAKPGDRIQLASPNGPVEFTLVGITAGQIASALVVNREQYRRMWNDPLLSWIYVDTERNQDSWEIKSKIEKSFGRGHHVQVLATRDFVDYFAEQARRAFSLLYLTEVVMFILLLVAIGDTLAASVVQRTREYGMMRAVGLSRTRLFALVVLEGAGMGAFGILLGVVAGLALGLFWVTVQFPALLGWKLTLHFPAGFTLSAAGMTLVLCVLGSLLPALWAARLPVPSALRSE